MSEKEKSPKKLRDRILLVVTALILVAPVMAYGYSHDFKVWVCKASSYRICHGIMFTKEWVEMMKKHAAEGRKSGVLY